MQDQNLPWIILLLPLLSAATILLFTSRNRNISALISTGTALIAFALAVMMLNMPDDARVAAYPWLMASPEFFVEIGFQLDQVSRGLTFLATAIAAAVQWYSLGWMGESRLQARYFGALSLLLFSTVGIVMASNLVMIFLFFQLAGFSTCLLIGCGKDRLTAADAAKRVFLVNYLADCFLLAGILLLWSVAKSVYISDIQQAIGEGLLSEWSGSQQTLMVLLLFCGAIGKSAMVPWNVWLSDSVESPAPAAALIHSSTMIVAGVLLLARLSFLIPQSTAAGQVIAWVGVVTILVATVTALQQDDILRLLSCVTLGQVGSIVMAMGIGAKEAALFCLYTHSFAVALMFLSAGAVIHSCNDERDIWKLRGLAGKMPIPCITMGISSLSLAGLPLVTAGFFGKKEIFLAALQENKAFFVVAAFSVLLTAFALTRLIMVVFFGETKSRQCGRGKAVPLLMLLPLVFLLVPTVLAGNELFARGLRFSPAWVERDSSMHPGLIGILLILPVLGAGLAVWGYRGEQSDPLRAHGAGRLLARGFYIDDVCLRLSRVFLDGLAAKCNSIDRKITDIMLVRLNEEELETPNQNHEMDTGSQEEGGA